MINYIHNEFTINFVIIDNIKSVRNLHNKYNFIYKNCIPNYIGLI